MADSLIPGTFNARDLGGMPLRGGGAVASGALLRADALGAVPAEGEQRMSELGVRTVVDLRTAAEREVLPDRVPGGTEVLALPLLEGALTGLPTSPSVDRVPEVPDMEKVYTLMLEHGAQAFAEIARRVGSAPAGSAVLVHCTAGKDRTGVAVALLLEAVGAEREAVIADYTRSQDQLDGPWAERTMAALIAHGAPDTPMLRTLVTQTPREVIEHALGIVDAQHGGAAAYLRSGGLTDEELAALRERLAG